MKAILVWILVSVSDGTYNHGNVSYSPYLASIEDCVRLQKTVTGRDTRTQCVQVNVLKETK